MVIVFQNCFSLRLCGCFILIREWDFQEEIIFHNVACSIFLYFHNFAIISGLAGTIKLNSNATQANIMFDFAEDRVTSFVNDSSRLFRKNKASDKVSKKPPVPNEVLPTSHQFILLMCSSFRFYPEE